MSSHLYACVCVCVCATPPTPAQNPGAAARRRVCGRRLGRRSWVGSGVLPAGALGPRAGTELTTAMPGDSSCWKSRRSCRNQSAASQAVGMLPDPLQAWHGLLWLDHSRVRPQASGGQLRPGMASSSTLGHRAAMAHPSGPRLGSSFSLPGGQSPAGEKAPDHEGPLAPDPQPRSPTDSWR